MGYFNAIYAAELPHRDVAVYMYLKHRANTEGRCWPSVRTIAKDLSLSRATVQRALRELQQGGMDLGGAQMEREWKLYLQQLPFAIVPKKEQIPSAKGAFCSFSGPGEHQNDAPRSYHLKVMRTTQRRNQHSVFIDVASHAFHFYGQPIAIVKNRANRGRLRR